jgi:hypothetical protein
MVKRKLSTARGLKKMGIAGEFECAKFADKRLKKRLIKIVEQFAAAPAASIPQACGNWAGSKASYRFFDNEAVSAREILAAHRQASLERMSRQKVVFAIQDTTFLNYSTHGNTEGLGPIGKNAQKTLGLIAHSVLAVNQEGVALGVLDATINAREWDPSRKKSRVRNREPIERKESYKWLRALETLGEVARCLPEETRVVSLSDRESDLYELFLAALAAKEKQASRVELLVRASQRRRIEGTESSLWDWIGQSAPMADLVIKVPARAGRKARMATLGIRFCAVKLQAPQDRQKYQNQSRSLDLWAIQAFEEHPPSGVEALCWRLLTTMPVENVQEAIEKVRWYTLRWQIEIFHKVLKSGCRVQERQLESVDRLERCLALDMVVAWRILMLSKVARETPQVGADLLLAEAEWKALYSYIHKTRRTPKRPPTLQEALRWIGQLGGFLGRRGDGEPGPVVLWRGLQRLQDITNAWLIFNDPETCG